MKRAKKFITDLCNKLFKKTEAKEIKIQHISIPKIELNETSPKSMEVYKKNRYVIEFPGIPEYLISSYKYMGTDVYSEKRWLFSKKVIVEDFSIIKIWMTMPSKDFDICDVLKDLEDNPNIGDITIKMLGATGESFKKIIIPNCRVSEIRVFREMDYSDDSLMYAKIIFKHKQRKLI